MAEIPQAIGSVPNPDPTARTLEQSTQQIASSREIVEAKIDGINDTLVARISGIERLVDVQGRLFDIAMKLIDDLSETRKELAGEKFNSIAVQFTELDKRTADYRIGDKTALSAALVEQEKRAVAGTDYINISLSKIETGFTKLIDQQQLLINSIAKASDEKITDLKGRMDRGEGGRSITDPALTEMARAIANLKTTSDTGAGSNAALWAVGAIVISVVMAVATIAGVVAMAHH